MHIFIDETGSFTGIGISPSISMIGGLVVPDSRLASLEKEYRKLRPGLPIEKGEVKGRKMTEKQIDTVVSLLLHHSALFEVAALDLGTHTEEGLKAFQAKHAESMTNTLDDRHHKRLVDQIYEFRRQWENFKLPLMVQALLTFELLPIIFEHATLYFCTRRPAELGHFHWVVDAKGTMDTPTEWELWWFKWVLPQLQNRSFEKAFSHLRIGDYSHMARFMVEPSDFVKEHSDWKEGDPPVHDLGKVFRESFSFSPTATVGLELVDIITNATRRALIGNLKPEGWARIPQLMIHRNPPQYIHFSAFGPETGPKRKYPYISVVKAFGRDGRNMLPANLKDKKW